MVFTTDFDEQFSSLLEREGHGFGKLIYRGQSKKISRWHHVPNSEQPLRTIMAVFGSTCLVEYSLFFWIQKSVKTGDVEKEISEAYASENLRERVAFRLPFSRKVQGPHIIWENRAYERQPHLFVWAQINDWCAVGYDINERWKYSAAKMYELAKNSLVDIINKERVDSIT